MLIQKLVNNLLLKVLPRIEKMLDSNTKMVFITAGMVVNWYWCSSCNCTIGKRERHFNSRYCYDSFQFEGKVRSEQALARSRTFKSKQVDSLVVINNNKLREVYGNLGFKGFLKKQMKC